MYRAGFDAVEQAEFEKKDKATEVLLPPVPKSPMALQASSRKLKKM
jgi:hypothetical protein